MKLDCSRSGHPPSDIVTKMRAHSVDVLVDDRLKNRLHYMFVTFVGHDAGDYRRSQTSRAWPASLVAEVEQTTLVSISNAAVIDFKDLGEENEQFLERVIVTPLSRYSVDVVPTLLVVVDRRTHDVVDGPKVYPQETGMLA